MKILSEKLGVSSNCRFYGFVGQASNYIKYFDTILFTSDWEGLPLTYWEAMANSIPIVSTDVGGAKEILVENNCGLVYPTGDIDEGEKALIRLMEDETLRLTLGKNGKIAIQNKYSIKSFKSFFENLYSNLMDKVL